MPQLALFLLALCAAATARMAYQLPIGVENYLSERQFSESFSCQGFPYGYYADIDNNCELFHICLPVTDRDGAIVETAQFTFACGNRTTFDQQTLTCTERDVALPCDQASAFFETANSGFGEVVLPEDN